MFALTGAALLVAIVYLIREFGDSGLAHLFSTDHDADLLVWAPPDTESVTGLKMGELNSHPEIKAVYNDMEPRKDGRIGFTMESVERMLVVGRINKDSKQDLLFVFRLNRKFDPNLLIKSGLATQKKRGNKSYLEFANTDCLYNPTGEVVLFSNNESFLFEAIEGKSARLRIPPELQKVIQRADGPYWSAGVGPSAQMDASVFSPFLHKIPGRNPEPHPLKLSEYCSTKVRGDRTEFREVYLYSSKEKAKLAAENLDEGFKKLMSFVESAVDLKDPRIHVVRVIYDSLKLEVSGENVNVTYQIPHSDLKRARLIIPLMFE